MFKAGLLLFLLLGFSGATFAAERTLVAEGDYVGQTKDGGKLLAHWKLWRLGSGEFEVLESPVKDASVIQIFRFDDKFLPIGYTLKTERSPARPGQVASSMTVACQFKPQELQCDTEYDGHSASASIPAKQPYVFQPGEFYGLDFCWFLTGIVRLSSHSKENEPVNVYVMTDREGHVGEISLEMDNPIKLNPEGEETAEVLGKTQVVKRFEGSGLDELSELRAISKGVVASVGSKSNPSIGFALSNYKEYEPWGPDR